MIQDSRFAVVVPAYREGGRIGAVVKGILQHAPLVVVVDDGSPDGTAAEAEAAGAHVIRHQQNRGKGAALETGFAYAAQQGLDFVITLDADGQHDPAHIPQLVALHREQGVPVVVGSRMGDPRTMPWLRRLTNRGMSALLSGIMGQHVADTQSGYRLYRTDVLPLVKAESGGFAAESETLLNLAAAGVKIGEVPIRVIYGDEKSKIRPVRDTVRFVRMLMKFKRQQARGKGRKQTP